MNKLIIGAAMVMALSGCTTTETAVHSFNGQTVEIELMGETFAFGSQEQKQAQLDAAQKQARSICGKEATFLSRRLDHQPQNGIYHVSARNIALYKCG